MTDGMTLPPGRKPVRKLGYLPDEPDERDFDAEQILAAPKSSIIVPASMMRYRVGVFDQRDASSCVSFATTRAIDMWLRAEYERRGLDARDLPVGAPGYIYFNARQRAVLDGLTRMITDDGSYPRLAMRAVQKLGYCGADAYPYEDFLAELALAKRERRSERPPPPTAYRKAFDQSGLRYYRISSTGKQRVADVARALGQNLPVIFGMDVDTAFMQNTGERVTSIDENDPDGGGHMMTVIEVTSTDVIPDNSWGPSWGQLGLGRISHDLFGSEFVSDVTVIEAAPLFSGGKVAA